MGDYLDTLSEFVAETTYADLSHEAVSAVRDVTLDTLGAIVAGSRLSENTALAQRVAERSGPSMATIIGHDLKAEPMLATLVNATSGVALEMDEGNQFGGGHPSVHVTPGALAVAEEMKTDGRQFIEAVLTGYEVSSRLGGATKVRSNVHSHGHWGVIGTAVAVAKLKRYDASRVRSIINAAAGMSPANTWTPCFEGATIRNAYPGRSGLMGILAVHMFECGYTGVADGPADVFGTILGESFDREAAIKDLGQEYRIQQNYFKLHACCRINHPPLEAVMEARHTQNFAPHDVEAVEIVASKMLDGMLGDYPDNMLAAKFHVPYAIAAALVRGTVDVSAFYSEAITDGRIRDLAERVRVKVDPEISTNRENKPSAKATIRLKDGRVLKGTARIVRGDYGNRIPRQELVDKFNSLTQDILGIERACNVIGTVGRLEKLRDIRELTSMLSVPAIGLQTGN